MLFLSVFDFFGEFVLKTLDKKFRADIISLERGALYGKNL